MYSLLKIASIQLDNSSDIISTASILRKLKNKILNLFDSSRRDKVKDLLNKADQLKPLLADIYSLIKKLESSIEDLDIQDYDNTVSELKLKITDLNSKLADVKETVDLSTVKEEAPAEISVEAPVKTPIETPVEPIIEKTKTVPKSEEKDWATLRRQRVSAKDKEFKQKKSIYANISTLSELGVSLDNIVESKIGPKGIYSSWGFIHFANEGKDPSALIELQKGLKDSDMRNRFYNDIPNYKIKSILPRELASKDDPSRGWSSGAKKPGTLEIKVESPMKSLPSPANNWRLSVVFILVDMFGEPTRKGNYIIYRQLVVAAVDDSAGKAKTWTESEAARNEQNLGKLEPNEPKK